MDIAIRAFQALAGRSVPGPVALVIFGEGPRRPVLEKLAFCGGTTAPGVIRFAGFRPDLHRCLRGMDVLLHTPRQEAFGLAVIEAMATRIPVIATSVGGVPDLVTDGQTGFLVPSEQPEVIADALERLLGNPELLCSMGREAQRVASAEYGSELYARRYLQLYERLLGRRAPAAVHTETHCVGSRR